MKLCGDNGHPFYEKQISAMEVIYSFLRRRNWWATIWPEMTLKEKAFLTGTRLCEAAEVSGVIQEPFEM